ncbi:MnhB domain-containing protein [Halobacteriaceae archaeon GCM10025711]
MSTVITRTTTRVVVPIIFVVSIALFLQGHNQPGGGFIAGVLTSTAFALIYIAFSIDFLEDEVLTRTKEAVVQHFQHSVVDDYRNVFAVGLTIAAGSGIVAMTFGFPFMTQEFWILHHVPIYGEVEIASAVAFDLGVYAVVVGSLLTILSVVGAE